MNVTYAITTDENKENEMDEGIATEEIQEDMELSAPSDTTIPTEPIETISFLVMLGKFGPQRRCKENIIRKLLETIKELDERHYGANNPRNEVVSETRYICAKNVKRMLIQIGIAAKKYIISNFIIKTDSTGTKFQVEISGDYRKNKITSRV